ncbi:LuxR C-terminal-related transcriptional regulator [Nostoc sp. TCL26-01]|uniref:helix-turn-helix transcriptional regulator n=1 Tax=Nostoc sp. TCL26-01 TaxID=2576904 RepID=UPI0015B9FB5F|nr:LuxR C-terminal-related transcriptional regulator [Nostoc sp. TCL26-01]QLE57126.1 LuxR family transcriptional regulator [Nostoc sp. TCL26-01]
MNISLQNLLQAIAHAHDQEELQQDIMAQVGEYFAAQRWRLFFHDQLALLPVQFQSVFQRALSVESNPVLRYLVEHHAPVHEGLVVSPKAWRLICPRADHYHVMLGPIVSNGNLIGGIGLTRDRSHPAFDTQNLADLSALCLHLSTRLTIISAQIKPSLKTDCLTPRQIEIAELVAQGLTNAEIGSTLHITEHSVKQALKRIFRKLDVSSRAEMVAQLSLKS